MEELTLVIQDIIKWSSIITCIVAPIYIIQKGIIRFYIEKQEGSLTELEHEMLWANWKQDKEFKRKEEWEQFLSTLKKVETLPEENPEIDNLKEEVEKLKKEKSNLETKLNIQLATEKTVMLFHKLATDKATISSRKIEESMKEIEEAYEIIKKKIYLIQ